MGDIVELLVAASHQLRSRPYTDPVSGGDLHEWIALRPHQAWIRLYLYLPQRCPYARAKRSAYLRGVTGES
jgi:hypothetical protein